jgi:hypothetical protein
MMRTAPTPDLCTMIRAASRSQMMAVSFAKTMNTCCSQKLLSLMEILFHVEV